MTATVTSIRAELRSDSDGIAVAAPRLSWVTSSSGGDWSQSAAEIELDGDHVVRLDGSESVLVAWPFDPIAPHSEHLVRVRVTGSDGEVSDWSEPHPIVAAFLGDGEWVAPMIGLAEPARVAQPVLLRAEFEVAGEVRRATLHATAHGAYQALINGAEVDDQVLKPGWTPFPLRIIHESTDVTSLLRQGANAIGIELAGGWYTERFGFRAGSPPFYGDDPAAAAQLRIEYVDGSVSEVVTGDDWVATGDGPVVDASIYDGEHYDARREQSGWAEPGFDAAGWSRVRVDAAPPVTPTARTSPAVRRIEELPVAATLVSASGEPILDFGQNLVGRLRIRVSGAAGDVVTLRHAEVLENDELGVRPLRLAKATDSYTLRGGGEETWEPRFTFHGFRYAQITGLPVAADAVTAIVIHSDLRRTGRFESSHALLNQLHENVVWGMRGNFLYLPTDCPQRDERLGWTGDIQVFSPTASFLYDADAFLSSWLVDLALEQAQTPDGSVPFIVPNVLRDAATPAAAWGDAATVVPTVLHERFGDRGVLEAQFDSMRAWSDCLLGRAGDRMLWEGGFQFGDWLDPTAPPEDAFRAKADSDVVASAHLYRSLDLTTRAAQLLGRTDDARRYGDPTAAVHAAFLREYVSDAGRIVSDAQTAYAMAIMFGLYRSDEQRTAMGERLAELVRTNGYRIGTGFVGTPLITDALTVTGQLPTAARLLLQTENPSWLYPVTMGATTIWERWNSMLEDGSINPGEMTSFNHYAFGAVGDWLHRTVAGLAPAAPGYRVIRIAPQPLDQLDSASASLDTPYGHARVGWHREGGTLVIEAEVPANTTAEVVLPGASDVLTVGSGTHRWSVEVAPAAASSSPIDERTSLAEIVDDPIAYAAILDALVAVDPELARRYRTTTRWTTKSALSQVVGMMPAHAAEAVNLAIADVNAGR